MPLILETGIHHPEGSRGVLISVKLIITIIS